MEHGSKWRRNPSDVSDESDKGGTGRKIPAISQTGSWRRGMTAQVGVTSPRPKTGTTAGSTGTLKTHSTGKRVLSVALACIRIRIRFKFYTF